MPWWRNRNGRLGQWSRRGAPGNSWRRNGLATETDLARAGCGGSSARSITAGRTMLFSRRFIGATWGGGTLLFGAKKRPSSISPGRFRPRASANCVSTRTTRLKPSCYENHRGLNREYQIAAANGGIAYRLQLAGLVAAV